MQRLLKSLFFTSLLVAPAGPSAAAAPKSQPKAKSSPATDDVFPLKIEQKDLPNGLRVLVVPTGFPNLVSIQIPVSTGSRNEVEEGKTGFAHFFEHMMFRGTQKFPSDVYQSYLTKMGARQNAYTSGDYTNYHTTFAKDDLEQMILMEADRFQHLDYSESGFKTESRAVLGEYNKNSAQPGSKLNEVTKDKAFQVHTYKHTTMGFLKDIENMPNQFAYSKTFFDRWYRPENATIIVAGDVEPSRVFALVEKYFGSWKRGSFTAKIPVEPPAKQGVYVHVPWESPTLPRLNISFHGPAFSTTDKEYASLALLYEVAFGSTSPLYKQLVIDEQKLDSLSANASDSKDPDLYSVGARLKDPKDTLAVRDAILKTYMYYTKNPVDIETLNKIRSNSRYEIQKSLDNTESIASLLATYVHYDRKASTLNDSFKLLDTVTPADIQHAAQKYFTDNNIVIATLSNGELPKGIETLPKLALYAPQATTLRANVPVIIQKSSSPFLNVKIQFRVGSGYDPVGKDGLANTTAALITDGGSKLHTFDEIQKTLFPLAASFNARTDKEMTTFTIRVDQRHADQIFDYLLPGLTDPGFRGDDFSRVKTELLNHLKNDLRTNNEEELGKERLQELIFQGTPVAHPVLGTVAGLEGLTVADVEAFAKANYTQGNMIIGVSGNITDAQIEQLKHKLSALPNVDGPKPLGKVAVKPVKGLRVNIIEKNTRATAISFGHVLDVTRADNDFAALWLARAWLGEHRSSMSHLFDRIREIRGMNYGDYAYIEAFPNGGYQFFPSANVARHNQLFEVWIRPVAPENAQMALRVAIFELNKLIQNGLTEKEFEDTRNYLMKNVFLMTSTQSEQLGYALDSNFYGIGEFTKTMRDRLQRLTLADTNAAIKKHLSGQNLQVVMVTKDAAGLKDALQKDAFSPIKYDGEKPKELLDEDKVIGALKLNVSDVTVTPVDQVFAGH